MRCCGYDELFDERMAGHDARRYRRKGLRGSARRLVGAASASGIDGAEVLEIGGGVGAVGIELLQAGAARVTNVELSAGYERAAGELLRERGLEGRVERRIGNAVGDPALAPADVVVMERVVCCYPDAAGLVGAAATLSRRLLVLTYPRYSVPSRVLVSVVNLLLRLRRSAFRAYTHPPHAIREAAAAQGLRPVGVESGLVWRLAAFERA